MIQHAGTPATLYGSHAPDLRRFLLALLRSTFDAEDVLQQVFLKLLDQWEAIEASTAKEWLYTVAYREAITWRRKRARDENALAELLSRPAWQEPEGSSPPAQVARQEEIEIVQEALAILPLLQREVVERRIQHGETFAAIAESLHLPLGTVLTRMRLALSKMKQHLEKHHA